MKIHRRQYTIHPPRCNTTEQIVFIPIFVTTQANPSFHGDRQKLTNFVLFNILLLLLTVPSIKICTQNDSQRKYQPQSYCADAPLRSVIYGCLCHGIGMTGARSLSAWQATAQITAFPERANALLMNNKSTLIINCQTNQFSVQHSEILCQLSCALLEYITHI